MGLRALYNLDYRLYNSIFANATKLCQPGRKLPSIGNSGGNLWRTVLEVNRELSVAHAKPLLTIQLIQHNLLTLQCVAVTLRNTWFSTLKILHAKIKKFHTVFNLHVLHFVRISRQTGAFALHSIDRLLSYNLGGGCLLCGTE